MAGEKILVVDDEEEISYLLLRYLSKENFKVMVSNTASDALKALAGDSPDLIILDILLPDLDGIELCQEIRKISSVPIIFLSSKNSDFDKIVSLGVGGDDYVTKPFSLEELTARIKAHLRRNRMLIKPNLNKPVLSFPSLEIDKSSYTVMVQGENIPLSAKEFQLLSILASYPNQVFSTEQLYEMIWGEVNLGDVRTVAVHISNLRKKLETNPTVPRYIQTVRGLGYKFKYLKDARRDI